MAKRLLPALQNAAASSRPQPPTDADAAPVVPELARTVQALVDRSMEGLEARLQASLRSLLQPGATFPLTPAPTPAAPDDDNISLPSGPGAAANLQTQGPSLAQGSPVCPSQPALASADPPVMDREAAVITGTTPPLIVPPTAPPAVPGKLRQRIVRGEYIDFDCLLPENMFPSRFGVPSGPAFTLKLSADYAQGSDGVVVAHQRPASKRSVMDLSSWLEAWNIYVAILVNQFPQRAASLLAYQRIISQASIHAAPQAWFRYDSRFRALAAEARTTPWDQKPNGSSASAWYRPLARPPLFPLPNLGARVPIAVARTISRTIAHQILFVPLAALHLPMVLASVPLYLPSPLCLNPGPPSYAGTLIKTGAPATHADSGMSAPLAGTVLTPSGTAPNAAPIETHQLVSPIRPLILERELATHPDKGFVNRLLDNFRHGCNIGYHGPHFSHIAPHLPSAFTHPHVIDNALTKECTAGRMAGPFSTPPFLSLRCSGLGLVPKKDGS